MPLAPLRCVFLYPSTLGTDQALDLASEHMEEEVIVQRGGLFLVSTAGLWGAHPWVPLSGQKGPRLGPDRRAQAEGLA